MCREDKREVTPKLVIIGKTGSFFRQCIDRRSVTFCHRRQLEVGAAIFMKLFELLKASGDDQTFSS